MTRPEFDLGPILRTIDPTYQAPPPAPVAPEPVPQPRVLQALCLPPNHRCDGPKQAALRRAVPVAILHVAEEVATLRVIANRPWQLTAMSRERLMRLFLDWASVDVHFDARCRAEVDGAVATFAIPRASALPFQRDVLDRAAFEQVPL